MIIGIGMDAVEAHRFTHWHTKPLRMLERVFSPNEISYCLQNKILSAQRFAIRFAAREAIYKIVNTHIPQCRAVPFLTLARAITITKATTGSPSITIDWQQLHLPPYPPLPAIIWHLSLTHTNNLAIACVVAETR